MAALTPSSPAALAAALGVAAAARRSIALRGANSKARMAGPEAPADTIISTSALTRVLQYDPRDLTISVEAGLPWQALTSLLAQHNQIVPLDPPCAAHATVGGVIASNSNGPRRRLYGAARDLVIGVTYATVEGTLAQSGGLVVKNVAGLDVQKALIGSFGTLAALAVVNLRLAPAPPASRTFVFSCSNLETAVALRTRILTGPLQPAALDLLTPPAAQLCGLDGYALALRAHGSDAVLARYQRDLPEAQILADEAATWQAIEDFAPSQPFIVKVAHPLADLQSVLASAPAAAISRAASGLAYLAFPDARSTQAWLDRPETKSWSSVVEWSSAPLPQLWPRPGDDFSQMQALKSAFDPHNLLNRGRLYGRI